MRIVVIVHLLAWQDSRRRAAQLFQRQLRKYLPSSSQLEQDS